MEWIFIRPHIKFQPLTIVQNVQKLSHREKNQNQHTYDIHPTPTLDNYSPQQNCKFCRGQKVPQAGYYDVQTDGRTGKQTDNHILTSIHTGTCPRMVLYTLN